MSEHLAQSKECLRREMRRRLTALSAEARDQDSRRLCRRLEDSADWHRAERTLGFAPLRTEPDILPALRAAAAAGRDVFIPRWSPVRAGYEAALLDPADLEVRGPWGVLEPGPTQPSLPLERLDLILVPGLAFDRLGHRLGRGRGFFDRLLTGARRARRWGIAFDMQIAAEVPVEPHDVSLDLLVTPGSWLPVSPP